MEIRACKHLCKVKYKICRYLQSGNLHGFGWFRVYYLQIIQQRKWTLWINAHLLAIWKNNKDLQLYFSLLFCLSPLLNSSISFNLLPATFQLLKRLLMRACSCAMPNVLWIWKVLKTSKKCLSYLSQVRRESKQPTTGLHIWFQGPFMFHRDICTPQRAARRFQEGLRECGAGQMEPRAVQGTEVPSSVKNQSFHPFRNSTI